MFAKITCICCSTYDHCTDIISILIFSHVLAPPLPHIYLEEELNICFLYRWRREVIGRGSHLALDLSTHAVRDDIFLWEEVCPRPAYVHQNNPTSYCFFRFLPEFCDVKLMYCPARWNWLILSSFKRPFLKREVQRFLDKSVRPPFCESPLKIPRHLVQLSAIRNEFPNEEMKLIAP